MEEKSIQKLDEFARDWSSMNDQEKVLNLANVWQAYMVWGNRDYDWWLPYFKEVGYFTNWWLEKPEDPITLYRGSFPEFKAGMSWTPHVSYAKIHRFLKWRMEEDRGVVYKMVVNPDQILAIIGPPFMREYIIDPTSIDESIITEVSDELH